MRLDGSPARPPRVAEFFAGIGLVRLGFDRAGFDTVFATDIDPVKQALYTQNFGLSGFRLADIKELDPLEFPEVDVATASFPCTDLSTAGKRKGIVGASSRLFFSFSELVELAPVKPRVVVIENVPNLAGINGGRDLRRVIKRLNDLGYVCDLLSVDARVFAPQSRPRIFIIGVLDGEETEYKPHLFRPRWVREFWDNNRRAALFAQSLPPPIVCMTTLSDILDDIPLRGKSWWNQDEVKAFRASLSALQARRLDALLATSRVSWRTAFRRMRNGVPCWEVRPDQISGCLRAIRGGSSRQAVVRAGRSNLAIRWMTVSEYARLQGADGFEWSGVSEAQALSAFGDAVCVPVVAWLARHHVRAVLPKVTAAHAVA